MIERIVHFADVHIKKEINRHDEYYEVIDNFIESIKNNEPDRIALIGDVFDDKLNTSNEMYALASYMFSKMSHHTNKVITVRGNHDFNVKNRTRMCTIKGVLNIMRNDKIVYLDKSGFYIDENVIWVVCDHSDKINPWFELKKNAKDKSKLFYTIDGTELNKEMLTKENIDAFMKNYKVITTYHDPISGSVNAVGEVMESKSYRSIGDFGGDLLFLGDIHKNQIFNR